MKINFRLKNELGEFKSEVMEVNEKQYKDLIQISKGFYSGPFEMYLDDGFMVVPPDILKKSILIIEVSEWS
jgi:hypothetical protein